MRNFERSTITAVESQPPCMEKKTMEEKSTPYKMGYCFIAIYTSSLPCVCLVVWLLSLI
ncbi:hypothetical protein M430DRAFT_189533 [Amorphotheca resinae ATCC 22711]|uniref:Transmembrane protein n=1 Tax=Amorphotheca resinae ATCC 22711 TaxID=857342 RepID=A0A2T3ARA9_AMORE|nr:hypothetical protein M430DRAFT_189533 [Amorphotheca resinae ATCC 22711]PSS08794.1 hypothetical protein M430DRAFT_189533 [Amorphotheca resinae ATCC 22711]